MKKLLFTILIFPFFYLTVFAQGAKLMLPVGIDGEVIISDFSKDAKKILITGGEVAKLWDAETGQILATFGQDFGRTAYAKFSTDEKMILVSTKDGYLTLWNVKSAKRIALLNPDNSKYYANSSDSYFKYINCRGIFNKYNNKILYYSDSTVAVWDIIAQKNIFQIKENSVINSAVFNADETAILVGERENHGARLINAKNGNVIMLLNEDKKKIPVDEKNYEIAEFNKKNDRILTYSNDSAQVWDAKNGNRLIDLKWGLSQDLYESIHPKFSPNGEMVLVPETSGMDKIWNVYSTKVIDSIKGQFRFSKEGNHILTFEGSYARLYDASSLRLTKTIKCHDSTITNARFSPAGNEFLTCSRDSTVKVWDTGSGKSLNAFRGFGGVMFYATYTDDGKKIVTPTLDRRVMVWDAKSAKLLSILKGHNKTLNIVNYSPTGGQIFMAYYKNGMMWDVNRGGFSKSFIGHKSPLLCANFSSDGKILVTSAADNTGKIWDAESGALLHNLTGFGKHNYDISDQYGKAFLGFVYSIDLSPDQKHVLTAADDGTVRVWDRFSGELILKLEASGSAMYTPDGKHIITMSPDSVVRYWDINTGAVTNTFKAPANFVSIASNGRWGVYTQDDNVKVWDLQEKKVCLEIPGFKLDDDFSGMSLLFSPDNKYLLTASRGYDTRLWDLENKKLVFDFGLQHSNVNSTLFDKKGSKLLVAGYDNIVKIWGTANGKTIATIKVDSTSKISSVDFSPDGNQLITSSKEGLAKIWDVPTGRLKYSFFQVDSADYLVTDPYGRYDGTEGARKLLYFTCGTEVIGLDQVKDQLWVPNLAERIMKGDSINAKKLSDLDICGLIPQVEKEERSGYHFMITPQRGGLGETVLFVNDIEVKRFKPNQLLKTGTSYELNITDQELQPYFIAGQENAVLVKAYTAKNDISSRGAKIIQDETKKQSVAPNLYAVMIGVSDYKGPELQLKYAAKDATDISDALKASAGKLLGKEHVFAYNLTTSANHYQLPEKTAIKNVLQEIGKKANANDILLIFFAGHGVTSGEKKQFYFLTADASQASATDAPDQVGISTAELSDWMKPANIKAQKRILILDACNSGQAINELVKVGNSDQNYLAARNDDKAEQIKAIDKLNEKSGLFILAASASNQSAYEMGRYSQGLLTYSLLKAIKQDPSILEDNKYLNVSQWFNAAEKTVSNMVRETGNRQEPQIVSAGNFNIGLVDQEVMAGIKLAEEKPLFTASNFQNSTVDDDNLEISSLINQNMYEISARNADTQISYVTASNSPDAWSLSGRYEIQGDDIIIKINIKQNREIKNKLEIKGKKADLKTLAENVVNQATNWILKIK